MAKRLKAIVTALLLVGAARGQAILAAVPSSDALKASLLKANCSTKHRADHSADPEHSDYVLVSTFLQQSATDSDCKIDALLIAKTVMELAGADVTRVTVSFFSTKDLSTYNKYL